MVCGHIVSLSIVYLLTVILVVTESLPTSSDSKSVDGSSLSISNYIKEKISKLYSLFKTDSELNL